MRPVYRSLRPPSCATSGNTYYPVRSFGQTDANGVVVLTHVQEGNFVAYATSGTRSGSTSGTIAAGQTQPITIQLAPTASISGTMFAPDGATPAVGSVVLYVVFGPSSQYAVATASVGANGQYRFDGQL
jgi:hypothetical protein